MNDIDQLIRKFNNDENVINLKKYYKSLSFMEILGVTRDERAHSSFLSWLFNPELNYDLSIKPLLLLLNLLRKEDDKKIFPIQNELLNSTNITIDNVVKEYPIEDGRIDVYIQFKMNSNQYAVVIENKVDAKENIESEEKNGIMQTEKYYNYFKNEKSNTKYIYVFLSPLHNGNKVIAKDEHFINISYNDIVDNIIYPILSDNNVMDRSRFILEDYLNVLIKPNLVDPDKTMKITTSEYELNLACKIKETNNDFGQLLMSNIESDILKEFLSNDINRFVVESVWPDAIKKKNVNSSFSQLGIKPGTKLYLAKCAESNEIQSTYLYVITIDELNKVEYIDSNGIKQVRSTTSAAKDLFNLNYNINGYKFFVYEKEPGIFINLFKINKI